MVGSLSWNGATVIATIRVSIIQGDTASTSQNALNNEASSLICDLASTDAVESSGRKGKSILADAAQLHPRTFLVINMLTNHLQQCKPAFSPIMNVNQRQCALSIYPHLSACNYLHGQGIDRICDNASGASAFAVVLVTDSSQPAHSSTLHHPPKPPFEYQPRRHCLALLCATKYPHVPKEFASPSDE